jgi:hypothetical protein
MLQQAMKDLRGDAIVARDGQIGSVNDVFFDDASWTVRYLVVDTGKWLPGRKVLISPHSVQQEARAADEIAVNLTREQVERSPGIDADQPVSRQFEKAHADYYGYPFAVDAAAMGGGAMPLGTPMSATGEDRRRQAQLERAARESHVRSGREVVGYSIQAADGPIGHVEDFLVDDEKWTIADMVVDTRNWLPGGKKVPVPPSAIAGIDWHKRQVQVRLTSEELRRAAEL